MTTRYDILTPNERGEGDAKKTYWTKIGSAWPKEGGNINCVLDALPLSGRFILSIPKPTKPKDEF